VFVYIRCLRQNCHSLNSIEHVSVNYYQFAKFKLAFIKYLQTVSEDIARATSFSSSFSSGDFGYSLLVYLVPIDHCGDLGVVLGIVACSYHKFTLIKPNLVNINAYSCHDILPLAILSVYFELVNISFDVVTLLNRSSFIIFMSNDCVIELIVARVIVFEDR